MKIFIDPGHGMANRKPGVWDPGCEGSGLKEAEVVLTWAEELAKAFEAKGIPVELSRRDQEKPLPVGARAELGRKAGATHLISIHVNDAGPGANGVETLYNDDEDAKWASEVQDALVAGLGLRDRGIKQRPDLAVLKFKGPAVLIELGFIKNARDVQSFMSPALTAHTCRLISDTLA